MSGASQLLSPAANGEVAKIAEPGFLHGASETSAPSLTTMRNDAPAVLQSCKAHAKEGAGVGSCDTRNARPPVRDPAHVSLISGRLIARQLQEHPSIVIPHTMSYCSMPEARNCHRTRHWPLCTSARVHDRRYFSCKRLRSSPRQPVRPKAPDVHVGGPSGSFQSARSWCRYGKRPQVEEQT